MRLALFAGFFHGGVDAGASPSGSPTFTCGNLKEMWQGNDCCTDAKKEFADGSFPTCPYDFNAPDCFHAGPQTPKDLTTAQIDKGNRFPAAPIMDRAQMNEMALVNVHWHLGSEHKSDAYGNEAMTNSAQTMPDSVTRIGFFGPSLQGSHDTARNDATDVPTCKDTKVGDVIEVHWVHSSAGKESWEKVDATLTDESLLLTDGLGQAANGRGLLNPILHVEATVYEIWPDGEAGVFEPTGGLFMQHMPVLDTDDDYVRYVGSSTGTSFTGNSAEYDPEVKQSCSPYLINWGVDTRLHKITSSTMKGLCDVLAEKGLVTDLAPHSARVLVNKLFVSPHYEKGLGGTTEAHTANMKP